MKSRPHSTMSTFTVILALLVFCYIYYYYQHAHYAKPTVLNVEYLYLSQEVPTLPITLDPCFERGLQYWGISTPNNGSKPRYTGNCWITHSRDLEGLFVYSSIIQGCKPYNWGCGNYIFERIPASERLYLSTSIVKETVAVYRKEGFAGALIDLWFENLKGDAFVIDLYLTRDVLEEYGSYRSIGKGFFYTFTNKNQFGKSYHFNYVLTEAPNGENITFYKLSLEPIIDKAFKILGLSRSDWWLVSVDAGAEAHYSEIKVYICMLEVGKIVEQ